MKIGVRLFVSSMVFAIAIAVAYGIATHDLAGMIFLGMMAIAMIVCAAFIVVAEREANLASDRMDVEPKDVAGESLGVFSLESYWPPLAALGAVGIVLGALFAPGDSVALLICALLLLGWTVRFFLREST